MHNHYKRIVERLLNNLKLSITYHTHMTSQKYCMSIIHLQGPDIVGSLIPMEKATVPKRMTVISSKPPLKAFALTSILKIVYLQRTGPIGETFSLSDIVWLSYCMDPIREQNIKRSTLKLSFRQAD